MSFYSISTFVLFMFNNLQQQQLVGHFMHSCLILECNQRSVTNVLTYKILDLLCIFCVTLLLLLLTPHKLTQPFETYTKINSFIYYYINSTGCLLAFVFFQPLSTGYNTCSMMAGLDSFYSKHLSFCDFILKLTDISLKWQNFVL